MQHGQMKIGIILRCHDAKTLSGHMTVDRCVSLVVLDDS